MSKAFWFPGGRWLNRLRDILRLYVGGMGFHDALGVYTITRPIHLFLPYTIICGKKKKKKSEMWRKLSFEVGGVAALIYLFCQMGLCHLKTTEWTNNDWIIYF